MPILQKSVRISPKEYLEGEKHSNVRHEYVAGHVYAMVGASKAHNRIALNLATVLNTHLRGGPCQVFMADVKVRVMQTDAFYYPDVLVACDPSDQHAYYSERPRLIIEVVSPSTEAKDALEKRIAYQTLDSLQEYVLVAQEKQEVKIYRRAGDEWDLETFVEGDRVQLASLNLEVPIETLYENMR